MICRQRCLALDQRPVVRRAASLTTAFEMIPLVPIQSSPRARKVTVKEKMVFPAFYLNILVCMS